ncbi:gluzincin family metallopeptidase [Cesiribacter andamanensis]|uniref:Peptidyl-dipeptidase dcp n=1 Tax=Cesiribacter andamanensis AMV16 TaxID=1279009 RepID=M7NCA1_9BACT|nr:peptidyl-dipeptidase Dcp [Cesiribacter andamanensis]EMR04771.1 Peptidyl-dipeptidase dcp [Cesiribacter andamanensis AMV16]
MLPTRLPSGTLQAAVAALLLAGCSTTAPQQTNPQAKAPTEQMETQTNPLLAEWTGPYGGVPAFDKMELAHIKPALERGMALHLAEIEAIANNPAPPTFANTIEAMEAAGEPLNRAFVYYGIWSSNRSTPEFRAIQAEMAPKISEHNSRIIQNERLFQRVKAVWEQAQQNPLSDDQQRVAQLVYENFAMEGADLDAAAKERYAAINKELSSLYTAFSNNILADEEKYVVYLSKEQLGGLPDSFVKAAAKAAADRGRKGAMPLPTPAHPWTSS